MPPEGAGNSDEVSERVARGFEALVEGEPLAVPTPPPQPPPPAGQPPPSSGAAAGPPPGPAPHSRAGFDPARLDDLEGRVRQTMDRLTELVEAQLPEAVDGLRADLETLRLELQTSLNTATAQLAEERRGMQAALDAATAQLAEERRELRAELQAGLASATEQFATERGELRSQIATTVGAANRWFVRTRDQLYERLDYLATLAAYDPEAAPRPPAAFMPAPAALAAGHVPSPPEHEGSLEWEVEGEASEAAAVDAALHSQEEGERPAGPQRGTDLEPVVVASPPVPEAVPWYPPPSMEAALDPVRGDLQELQVEVAAMGEAMVGLRDELERLRQRVPAARARGVRLEPGQVELIVESIMAVLPSLLPPPPSPPAGPARRSATKKAAAKKAAKKSTARAKKAAGASDAPTLQPRRATAFPRLYSFEDTE